MQPGSKLEIKKKIPQPNANPSILPSQSNPIISSAKFFCLSSFLFFYFTSWKNKMKNVRKLWGKEWKKDEVNSWNKSENNFGFDAFLGQTEKGFPSSLI